MLARLAAAVAFRIYDLDHTGYIEPSEVQRLLAALLSDNPAIDLSEAELQSIIEQVSNHPLSLSYQPSSNTRAALAAVSKHR